MASRSTRRCSPISPKRLIVFSNEHVAIFHCNRLIFGILMTRCYNQSLHQWVAFSCVSPTFHIAPSEWETYLPKLPDKGRAVVFRGVNHNSIPGSRTLPTMTNNVEKWGPPRTTCKGNVQPRHALRSHQLEEETLGCTIIILANS